jgi:hypothetical protein
MRLPAGRCGFHGANFIARPGPPGPSAVQLLPRRYIDNRFSELVGVPQGVWGES